MIYYIYIFTKEKLWVLLHWSKAGQRWSFRGDGEDTGCSRYTKWSSWQLLPYKPLHEAGLPANASERCFDLIRNQLKKYNLDMIAGAELFINACYCVDFYLRWWLSKRPWYYRNMRERGWPDGGSRPCVGWWWMSSSPSGFSSWEKRLRSRWDYLQYVRYQTYQSFCY